MGGSSPVTQVGQRPGRRVVRVADLLRLHPRVPVDTARHGPSAVSVDSILRREGRTGPLGVVLTTGTAHTVPRRRSARVTGALLVAGSAFGAATMIATQEPAVPGDPSPAAAPDADADDRAERDRVRVPLAELVPVAAPVEAPPAGPAPGDGWTQVAFPAPAEQDPGTAAPARSGGGSAPRSGPVEDLTATAVDLVGDTTTTVVRVEQSTDGPSGRTSSSSSSSVSGEGSASVTAFQSSTSGRGGLPDLDRWTGG
jgi:hypothetical protein